ncbi:MAG TPA: hypothetical protein ENL23_07465, partial [Candidatus Acetothermia bacterium]|nr:hypothetical protein [Candidatus Acetothermia bacterium]
MLISRTRKALLGIVAGASMALIMPGLPLGMASFIALIPFLFLLENGGRFVSSYICGFVFFLINLRWLFTLTRFDALAIPGVLLLFAYLAVFFGLFGLILGAIRKRWRRDSSLLMLFPVLFTLFEILRNVGPLALGFTSLYQSLYSYPVLIQIAAYLGPWSLTAVIAFVNVALYLAIRRKKALFAILAAGAISILLLFSLLPVNDDGMQIKVAIVSSQVSQEEKLDDRNLFML